MLIDCHAHVVPASALRRFPDPTSPRYVTAEPLVLGRMLEAHDRAGITHAVVSDSFYLESARDALPQWSSSARAGLFNDGMAELVGRYPGRLFALAAIAMLSCTPAVAQENLDAGKSAPKLFAESCAACHRSAKGLAKGRFSFTLYLYLQKHYASNSSSAWALTSYLESVDAAKRAPTRAASNAPAPSTGSSTRQS